MNQMEPTDEKGERIWKKTRSNKLISDYWILHDAPAENANPNKYRHDTRTKQHLNYNR